MKNITWIALLLIIAAFPLFPAVSQELSGPEKNFEHLWKTLDRNYAIFGPRHVDWQALYKLYRPRVTAQTSDDELFAVMTAMRKSRSARTQRSSGRLIPSQCSQGSPIDLLVSSEPNHDDGNDDLFVADFVNDPELDHAELPESFEFPFQWFPAIL